MKDSRIPTLPDPPIRELLSAALAAAKNRMRREGANALSAALAALGAFAAHFFWMRTLPGKQE